MNTKYDIGDVVLIQAKVRNIYIKKSGRIHYDLEEVAGLSPNDVDSVMKYVSEENIACKLEYIKQ